MVEGLAAAAKIQATPTIRLNGQDISPASPEDLVTKVKAVVGNVPGLDSATPPAPGAPAGPGRACRTGGSCCPGTGRAGRPATPTP